MSLPKRIKPQMCIAEEIWLEIKDSQQPADRWLGNYFHKNRKRMGSRDRRFFSEIIYSHFRHKRYIEHITTTHFDSNTLIGVVIAAVMANMVEIDEAVQLLSEFYKDINFGETLEIFNQYLPFDANKDFEDVQAMSLHYSFLDEMVERWEKTFGIVRAQELVKIFHQRPPLIVRANALKVERNTLIDMLEGHGFQVEATADSPTGIVFNERIAIFNLDLFKDGLFEVQDEGSQRVCQTIAPHPTDVIWDVCAGAGGKALGLASMMKNKGRVVATDIRSFKLQDLKKRAKRAGAFNIFAADLDRMDEMKVAKQGFDKILVDAPCSGSGTLKRNPDAKWKIDEERIMSYPSDQLEIMKKSWPYLKVGGKMFYVTCSIERVENEEVIESLLNSFQNMKHVALEDFGEKSALGSRLWPSNKNDGFFMACVEKVKEDL